MKNSILVSLLASMVVLAFNSGCNIYTPFDDPTNPEQLLSHARACFDDGDLGCAREEYAKISTGPYSDQANSELAFALLDDAGATMGAFLSAIGNDKSLNFGGAITSLGNRMGGASLAKRKIILEAYSAVKSISDPNLKALVQFTTSFALAAEMFAEGAVKKGDLQKSDLVVNPTACLALANDNTACIGAAACASGAGTLTDNATALSPDPLDLTSLNTNAAAITAVPVTLPMIQSAITAMQAGLTSIGASGKFSSGTKFSTDVLKAGLSAPACYRYALITLGVGRL